MQRNTEGSSETVSKECRKAKELVIHLELEESEAEEPLLTVREEEGLAASKNEIAEGKGLPFKKTMNELW